MDSNNVAYETLPFKGLVRDIYDDFQKNCHDSPQFSLATALTIIGTCAQSSYIFPRNYTPNLFTLLHAPASTGKEAFLNRFTKIIELVNPKLIPPEPRSGEAFRSILGEYSTRVFVLDEYWNQYGGGYLPRPDSRVEEMVNMQLQLYGNRPKLKGTKTKTGYMPDVIKPRVGFFSVTTFRGLQQVLKESRVKYVGAGTMSRMYLAINNNCTFRKMNEGEDDDVPVDASIISRLLRVFYDKVATSFIETETPSGPPTPITKIKISEAAKRSMGNWWEHFQLHHSMMDHEELMEGGHSVVARGFERVRKFACIHALGCGRHEILEEDVDFAAQLGLMLVEQDLALVEKEGAVEFEQIMVKVEARLDTLVKNAQEKGILFEGIKFGLLRNQIRATRDLKGHFDFQNIIRSMAVMGRIRIVQEDPLDPMIILPALPPALRLLRMP